MKIRRRADFFLLGQAALIVLPVAILSVVALYFLRQDQASILQDARDRAQLAAPELARHLGQRAGELLQGQLKESPQPEGSIANGRIVSPPDYSRLPEPPDWPEKTARALQSAEEAQFQRQDPGAAKQAFAPLILASEPPATRANAQYAILLLDAERGASPALVKRSIDLARGAPAIASETGAPVADLALLFAFRHSMAGHLP
jgi:hypothetical protein